MLDMGFKPAVSRIVAHTPEQRQTLFFSATLEGAIGKLASAYTRDPRQHTHAAPERSKAEIEHRFVHVDSQAAKLDHLAGALQGPDGGRTLVFVRTKRGADRLVKRLRSRELEAVAMHGDKSQGQRERALARFERGEVEVLVATDVAARGIDVADIAHVINFDAPGDRDSYVHRVGRTGRAGRRGAGTSFVLTDQAAEMRRIARDLDLTREFEQSLGHVKGAGSESSSNGKSAANRKPASGQQRSRRRRRRKVAA
jgi:superfamily II DNA/RNA helicase